MIKNSLQKKRYKTEKYSFYVREFVNTNHPAVPIIMIHGIGVSGHYMEPTGEYLANNYNIYIPDLPGFGKSSKPRKVLNLDELAESISEFMSAAGIRKAHFVGNSLGCQYLTHLSINSPEKVQSLVLIGPTINKYRRTVKHQIIDLLLDAKYEPLSHMFIILKDYARFGPRRMLRTLQFALQDDVETYLPNIRQPALVIRGEYDPISPDRWSKEYANLLPNGKLVTIKSKGHAVNKNAPEELAEACNLFIQSLISVRL